MLEFYFDEYCYLVPFLMTLGFQWFFFIKNNFFTSRIKPAKTDKLTQTNVIKKLHYKNYTIWNVISLTLLFTVVFTFNGFQQSFWWNHFKITNFSLILILILLTLGIVLNMFVRFLPSININYSVDYFFTVGNLAILLLTIFLSNTLYTFLFVLELNSSLIFYKFVVSKFWFKSNKFSFLNNYTKFNKVLPKFYLNMLFFQYWVTFFSSVLILYALINLLLIYGSSEWVFIEYLSYSNFNILYFSNWFFFGIIWFSFFIGLLLKIGFTPLHLFKIEVYKGLPFISIFFYTTYYFLVFFLFFIVLLLSYLYSVVSYWWFLLLSLIIFGGVYIIFLFFDVNYIKAFFAYSTIINTYSLFCLLMTML